MTADATTIAYVHNTEDIPVGRITMQDDHDAPCTYEGPHDYAPGASEGVTVRAVYLPSTVRDGYYETPDSSDHDDSWSRIREGENAEGIGQYLRTGDEAVELFTRYMRVFHPLVPVVERWVQTGYSQGDTVRLIAWADERPTSGPVYQRAAAMHERCEHVLDYIGQFARGQFVSVAYEEMSADSARISDSGDEVTLEVSWTEADRMSGVMYEAEFNPAPEALEYAMSLDLPDGCVIAPTFER
ncbi:hypothetical protein [Brevibacterium album]|uniref:hypothetical protein n=1 Tax=Brevibacterium album TaxID=417948 RepID=UPI0004224DAE|nr:hypothetical protein [Brevibacterium album]